MFWIAWDPHLAFTHLTLDTRLRGPDEPEVYARGAGVMDGEFHTLCLGKRRRMLAADPRSEDHLRTVSCPECLARVRVVIDCLRRVLPGGHL